MIWHDYKSAGKCSERFARLRKLNKGLVHFLRHQKSLPFRGATSDEIDRCALKNRTKAAQTLGHGCFVAAVSDRRKQVDSAITPLQLRAECQIDDPVIWF